MPEKEDNKNFYLNEEDSEEPESGDKATQEPASVAAEPLVVAKTFKLFGGEELSIDQLPEVTYRYPASKIYILGEHDSGKTTILATLFEMFQVAPFHGLYYAGSLTQIGFEKRCFYSRLASENEDADTERTKSEEFHFLHIALKSDLAEKKATHFLISDISGEKIKRAKSITKDMKDLAVISDSTHVSYVIDGEKLIDIKTRQAVLTQAKIFIRKAIDEKVLDDKTRLSVIVSKCDLLSDIADFDFISLIENPFSLDFKGYLNEIKFLKLAVRPQSFNKFKLGHGLSDLLNLWLSVKQENAINTSPEPSSRMINNLIF